MFINNPWSKQEKQPSFANTLATGLSNLADYKVKAIEKKKKEEALRLSGVSPHLASIWDTLHPSVQKSAYEASLVPAQHAYEEHKREQEAKLKASEPVKLSPEELHERNSQYDAAKQLAESGFSAEKEAQRKLGILKEMRKINKTGTKTGAIISNLANLTGTAGAFTSKDTQLFNKLSADLLPKGLTQEQLRSERAKWPSVGQSRSAQLANIEHQEKELQKEIKAAEAIRQAIKSNGGKIPLDLQGVLHQQEAHAGLPGVSIQAERQLLGTTNELPPQAPEGSVATDENDNPVAIFQNGTWVPYQG
jgi:hypothetical protein